VACLLTRLVTTFDRFKCNATAARLSRNQCLRATLLLAALYPHATDTNSTHRLHGVSEDPHLTNLEHLLARFERYFRRYAGPLYFESTLYGDGDDHSGANSNNGGFDDSDSDESGASGGSAATGMGLRRYATHYIQPFSVFYSQYLALASSSGALERLPVDNAVQVPYPSPHTHTAPCPATTLPPSPCDHTPFPHVPCRCSSCFTAS